ncbi:O-antigen ligase family protein [Butyrivibrio fibrisolvens]|uniref:O-antigen ligase family protein n=1 Tax=Butyrivibrio fibrisolvens TaxID=831 RepID=UPI00040C9727|nr:O-antigen ligase family protein [Butyrivibrio fibrisolvens]
MQKEILKKIENKIVFYLMVFYPIWISVGRFIPFVETILTLLIGCVLAVQQLPKKKTFIKYALIAVLLIISYYMYPVTDKHIEHAKMIIIFFMSIDAINSGLYLRSIRKIFKYRNTILVQIVCILLINILFAFGDYGYSADYEKIWHIKAFQGIYSDPHQCAYHICVLIIFMMWISQIKYSKYHLFIILGLEYCVLITGARVPSFAAIVLGAIYFIDNFVKTKKNDVDQKSQYMIKLLITIMLFIIAAILIMNFTAFGKKMLVSIENGNFDNGRSSLRTTDLEFFSTSTVFHKIFGSGTDAVRAYHASLKYGQEIWSHNDFLQIICGMGIIMLVLYCWSWIKLLIHSKKISINACVIVITMIMVSFMNGLYIHSRLVFVIPLLVMYMQYNASKHCN